MRKILSLYLGFVAHVILRGLAWCMTSSWRHRVLCNVIGFWLTLAVCVADYGNYMILVSFFIDLLWFNKLRCIILCVAIFLHFYGICRLIDLSPEAMLFIEARLGRKRLRAMGLIKSPFSFSSLLQTINGHVGTGVKTAAAFTGLIILNHVAQEHLIEQSVNRSMAVFKEAYRREGTSITADIEVAMYNKYKAQAYDAFKARNGIASIFIKRENPPPQEGGGWRWGIQEPHVRPNT